MIKLHLGCGIKHIEGFNKLLSNVLKKIGFTNIEKYNTEETEYTHIDDYSKSYIPHMGKTGLLMSLNIEATK